MTDSLLKWKQQKEANALRGKETIMKKLNTVSVKDLVRIAGGTAEEALAYYNELLEKGSGV